MISTQWFCKMRGMADKGLEAVRSGETKIVPERFEKVRIARVVFRSLGLVRIRIIRVH